MESFCVSNNFFSLGKKKKIDDYTRKMEKKYLFANVTQSQIRVIKHYISRPVRPVLGNSQSQPGLVVSVVMDDSCILYLCFIKGRIIAKPQDMPTPMQRIGQVIESDQSRRQRAKFPKCSVLILQ